MCVCVCLCVLCLHYFDWAVRCTNCSADCEPEVFQHFVNRSRHKGDKLDGDSATSSADLMRGRGPMLSETLDSDLLY